jgi:hypothetical protein
LDWLEATLEEAIVGLESLTEKMSAMPESMRTQLHPVEKDQQASSPAELRLLAAELVGRAVRADQRAWARIADCHKDVLEPGRSPRAPRTLADLRVEVEGLEAAWRETEDSFQGLCRSRVTMYAATSAGRSEPRWGRCWARWCR